MHGNNRVKKEMACTFCIWTAEPGEHKNFFEEVAHSLSNMVNVMTIS